MANVHGQLETPIEDLLERIRKALEDRNLSRVAKAVGLHENTVRAIASGKNKNPSFETLTRLSNYIFG
jgi:transcriptional regulator with XRE-family HTH domain